MSFCTKHRVKNALEQSRIDARAGVCDGDQRRTIADFRGYHQMPR
jgi:hypothetical protein